METLDCTQLPDRSSPSEFGDIPWEELLDDLFGSIINELNSHEVAWVRGVCSSWRTKAQKLLHCIQYNLSDEFPFSELVEVFPALKNVRIQFRGQHPELTNLAMLGRLHCLTSLELCNTRGVWEFPFLEVSVLVHCENLESLKLDGCRFEAAIGIRELTQLRSLVLTRCTIRVREPSLAQLLQDLKKLESLRIDQMAGGSTVNLRGISSLAQLRALTVRVRAAANPEFAMELGRMTWLKALDVNLMLCPSLTTFNDTSLVYLVNIGSLEELNLGGHGHITDDGVESLSRLSDLVSLDISVPNQGQNSEAAGVLTQELTDRGLVHLLRLGKLRSLSVAFSKVSNRLICLIMQRFNLLQHLSIAHCPLVNDTALFNLDRCPHLTSLDVSQCRQISDLGLFGISKVAPQLRILNLSGCYRLVTDLGVRQLAQLKLLNWLSLAYCEQVSDYGVIDLISGTSDLKTLSLRGCFQISDQAVNSISFHLAHLQDLDLGYCYRVSDAAIDGIKSMKSLRRIALTDTSVSSVQCIILREKGIAVQRENRWWMN
eukprot:g2191.t1